MAQKKKKNRVTVEAAPIWVPFPGGQQWFELQFWLLIHSLGMPGTGNSADANSCWNVTLKHFSQGCCFSCSCPVHPQPPCWLWGAFPPSAVIPNTFCAPILQRNLNFNSSKGVSLLPTRKGTPRAVSLSHFSSRLCWKWDRGKQMLFPSWFS